jgi:hypothetical protein
LVPTGMSDLRETGQTQKNKRPNESSTGKLSEDDFFASLMTDLNASPSLRSESLLSPYSALGKETNEESLRQDDDFFANLEAELEASMRSGSTPKKENPEPPPEGTLGDKRKQSIEVPLVISSPSTDETSKFRSLVPTSMSDLSKNTVPTLKDMLRERGLKVSGTKSELVERLLSS